jgi:hypothetical protein
MCLLLVPVLVVPFMFCLLPVVAVICVTFWPVGIQFVLLPFAIIMFSHFFLSVFRPAPGLILLS